MTHEVDAELQRTKRGDGDEKQQVGGGMAKTLARSGASHDRRCKQQRSDVEATMKRLR